ncbi:hypothetical protein [Geomonas sp.]|nr:hypothetical protein [Geomonas sp.]HJV36880.1 hypothetical protein [Geomonas sp.]
MISLLVGFIAVALVVVAFQLSCLFAYQASKQEQDEQVAAEPCFAE